ncbi:hypothetical protein C0R09_01345 [Brevibacillus laterosporus]|uniref:DUF6063 family protein n=1 Tax=Brevibacillus laterosporus TaxID=1465 RepID=UPI000C75B2EC|nr:DUF6063 family protein [Brevibacillus laterosporus]AUM63303.1 hypothetical protein C0R09_01345 [Brevibacillus laterosporus]
MYDTEDLVLASKIYFKLVQKNILTSNDPVFRAYREQDTVREMVKMIADGAETQLIDTGHNLHLVANSEDCVFATNFSQLKERNNSIENKRFFQLYTIILCVFLAEIDIDDSARLLYQNSGVFVYKIEDLVHSLFTKWKNKLLDDPEFGEKNGIAIKPVIHLWENLEVEQENQKGEGKQRGGKTSRVKNILTAMKILEQEQLVHVTEETGAPIVYPKRELFERMEGLYHNNARYQEIKRILTEKGDVVNAQY